MAKESDDIKKYLSDFRNDILLCFGLGCITNIVVIYCMLR
jgi:hypothetical protein